MAESANTVKKDFQWTDDEAELLLHTTRLYKVKKEMNSEDWESVKSKYDDIFKMMQAELPETEDEAKLLSKDYKHTKGELTKAIVTTKLKNIKAKFRKAVDAGKKSGFGRVVLIYYELCENIWGGSPATTQIDGGLETTDIVEEDTFTVPRSPSEPVADGDTSLSTPSELDAEEDSSVTITHRRQQLDITLKNYKYSKMTKCLPTESKITEIAKEELELKKRMVEQIDRMDKAHQENLAHLTVGMDKISSTIELIASVFKNMVPQQPNYYPQRFQPTPMQPFMPIASQPRISHPPPFPEQHPVDREDSPGPYSLGTPGNQTFQH